MNTLSDKLVQELFKLSLIRSRLSYFLDHLLYKCIVNLVFIIIYKYYTDNVVEKVRGV